MSILVVDDSKVMRAIVRRTLRQAGFGGHDVVEAANGAEALDTVRSMEQLPDLILCDWNMPGMNGIELLTELRADGVQVPFGFVTSESTDDMKSEATEKGAQFFISKPFTPDTFEEKLGPVLS